MYPQGIPKKVSNTYEAVSVLTNKLSAFRKGNIMEEIFLQHLYIYEQVLYNTQIFAYGGYQFCKTYNYMTLSLLTHLYQLDFDSWCDDISPYHSAWHGAMHASY